MLLLIGLHIFLQRLSMRIFPKARKRNVLTGICLSTIGLMATRSLLVLVTARSVRILLLSCFLVQSELSVQTSTKTVSSQPTIPAFFKMKRFSSN